MAGCQTEILGIENTGTPDPPILIVFGGESNSGGLADNTFATGPELAARNLTIFDNVGLASFDPLEVGVNNLVGHLGLIYAMNDAHGWELELANRYDDGDFGGRDVFLCKAGQGGTMVAMWADEATYSAESQTIEPFDVFIARVQAAIALIESQTGQTPDVFLFWSLGINDNGNGTPVATFKAAQKDVFDDIRAELGINLPIYMTQFQSMGSMTTYDVAIGEIASEMTDVTAINTTGAETAEVFAGPGSHWGYTGMKQVANSLINALISDL